MSNDGWIKWEWTEEKPYPDLGNTMIDTKWSDGDILTGRDACSCSFWSKSRVSNMNAFSPDYKTGYYITHYRITST